MRQPVSPPIRQRPNINPGGRTMPSQANKQFGGAPAPSPLTGGMSPPMTTAAPTNQTNMLWSGPIMDPGPVAGYPKQLAPPTNPGGQALPSQANPNARMATQGGTPGRPNANANQNAMQQWQAKMLRKNPLQGPGAPAPAPGAPLPIVNPIAMPTEPTPIMQPIESPWSLPTR